MSTNLSKAISPFFRNMINLIHQSTKRKIKSNKRAAFIFKLTHLKQNKMKNLKEINSRLNNQIQSESILTHSLLFLMIRLNLTWLIMDKSQILLNSLNQQSNHNMLNNQNLLSSQRNNHKSNQSLNQLSNKNLSQFLNSQSQLNSLLSSLNKNKRRPLNQLSKSFLSKQSNKNKWPP